MQIYRIINNISPSAYMHKKGRHQAIFSKITQYGFYAFEGLEHRLNFSIPQK